MSPGVRAVALDLRRQDHPSQAVRIARSLRARTRPRSGNDVWQDVAVQQRRDPNSSTAAGSSSAATPNET
jgi:hypothetical protein